MKRITLLLLLPILLLNQQSFAQRPFETDFGSQDLFISGVALFELLRLSGSESLSEEELGRMDSSRIPGLERHVAKNLSHKAMVLSDKMLMVSIYGHIPNSLVYDDFGHSGLISLQVFMVNDGLNYLAKRLFKRRRPFVYNSDADDLYQNHPAFHKYNRRNPDAYTSFYSGHTAHAAAYSFASATLFAHYYPESTRTRTAFFALAGAFPAMMAHLRVRAGKHFVTDVATGYIAGAAIGYLVPALHRTDEFKASMDKVQFRQDLTVAFASGILTAGALSLLSNGDKARNEYKNYLKGKVQSRLEPSFGPVNGFRWTLRF